MSCCRSWRAFPDEALVGLGEALGDFDCTADLGRLRIPTIVLCGDRDRVTPLPLSRRLAGLIPHSELEVIDGAGHMVIWERVAPVADALRRLAAAPSPLEP